MRGLTSLSRGHKQQLRPGYLLCVLAPRPLQLPPPHPWGCPVAVVANLVLPPRLARACRR